MASLPVNADPLQIEEELLYQQVLIDSLDQGAEDYYLRLRELEVERRHLEQRLESAMNTAAASAAAPEPPPNASEEPDLPSPPFAVKDASKRPRPESLSVSEQPHKRPTPPPSSSAARLPSYGSSSNLQNPNSAQRMSARARQIKMEEEMAIMKEQRKADEDLAKHLSRQNNPSPQPLAGPSSRPGVQTILNRSGSFQRPSPHIVPATNSGPSSRDNYTSQTQPISTHALDWPYSTQLHPPTASSLRDDWPYSTQMYPGPVPSPRDEWSYYGTQSNPAPAPPPLRAVQHPGQPQFSTSTPNVKSETSNQLHSPLTHRQQQSSDVVDLTGDDDDDAALLTRLPNPSAASFPHQPQRSLNSSVSRHVPGAFHSNAVNSGQHGYGRPPVYSTPQYGLDWAGRTQSAGQYAFNGIRNVASALASPLQQLDHLFNGTSAAPYSVDSDDEDGADSEVTYHGSRRLNPHPGIYAGHEDLYRSRYDVIESHNPEKTREEINALLNNIRPDEELPDHVLVETPSAMTIKLHKYQELGLTWLKNCEEGSNKGGILADDMGLGKTIQILSLLVTRSPQDPRCRTTLIVAPVALLRQWAQEIKHKIRGGLHALSVYIHHGAAKKSHFRELQQFDVVLTTFGSLAAETKRMEKFQLRKRHDPQAQPNKSETCTLIGPDCRWHRVILDEAQCIKNKNTQTAKGACLLDATYRFCMTGTPMMNNVDELYSLIKFLRIKPYDRWEKYRADISAPLRGAHDEARAKAMTMLQALCKAIMLRRTKKSEYHGQPILVLPERTTEVDNAEFDADERSLYTSLESRTQVDFNKYLRAGTVGRSYSAILVLLLRLRQACCHPHLIRDFSIAAAADVTQEDLVDLAKQLPEGVVTRIKSTGGNFECPVCMDACVNPAIFIPCGHDTCRDCFVRIADPANAIREGNEGAPKARCPHCRADIDPKRITDFQSFKRVYMPELLTEEEKAEFDIIESGSDDEGSQAEEVDDEDSEAEEAGALDEIDAGLPPSKKQKEKTRGKGKGKGKGKEKAKQKHTQLTLAELRKHANRSASARKKYLRRLREDYQDSAKIRKTTELLAQIMSDPEGEKVLIFSQWTSLLDLVEVRVEEGGWGYRRYDGSMNAKMRADAVDDFKDKQKDVRVMLVSLKAGNAGLNLNVASQVIILDPFWNPYIEEQAIDRAHRIGQARPVKVHRILVQQTVEDRIVELQENKRKLIEQALDEREASQLGRLGARELAYLFGVTSSVNQPLQYREAGRR